MDEQAVLLERLLLRTTLMELGRIAQASAPLTLAQFFALMAAHRHPDGCTMSDLAAETQSPRSTVTSLVDRLVDLGLVERLRDASGDRRQVRVRPTDQGRALLERVRQVRRADVARALPPEADLSAANQLLRAYIATLAREVYPDGHCPPGLFVE